jgi:hypothetical protein
MAGEYAFEIDSNVGRYWLANGEGFDVVVEQGRRLGIVEDVVVNPLTHEVSSVVVRRRLSGLVRRPAKVAIGDLTAVLPASRRFLVTPNIPSPKRRKRTTRAIGIAATTTGTALASGRDRARANWPAVRRGLLAASARVGDALTSCVAVSSALAEASWRWARERLRESGLEIRSRAGRAR